MIKSFRGIFSLLILCVLFFTLSACSVFFGEDDEGAEDEGTGIERYPDLVMRSFIRSAVDQEGRLLWQIKAREGRIFNDLNHMYLTDFIFYSFAEDGSLSSTLRARRGFMDNNESILTAKLDVVLRSENGRLLETEELYANNNDKIIYNNNILNRITQEDGTVMIGTELWAQSDLEVFKLQGTQGEAPEGAEDNMFGGDTSKSSSSAQSSAGAAGVSAGQAEHTAQASSRGSAAAGDKPSGSASSASSPGQPDRLLPDYDEESLEQLRGEIAFPKIELPVIEDRSEVQRSDQEDVQKNDLGSKKDEPSQKTTKPPDVSANTSGASLSSSAEASVENSFSSSSASASEKDSQEQRE
jgi:LPS export ABC transporter protein LptC